VAEVKFVYIPYYAISDSVAEVSDDALSAYYNKNKERFKTEETRNLKYVVFPVTASSADTAAIQSEMKRIATELAETEDDSAYAASNSDAATAYAKVNAGNLPAYITAENLQVKSVIGPVLDGGSYKVVKISAISKDTVYSARASHILIKWDDTSEASKKSSQRKSTQHPERN
jgi:peptidyl-prolyl cis-trans isomerase D